MKLVLLDGYACNPGDLSYAPLSRFGEVTLYDRTPSELAAKRIGNAELILTNKVPITKKVMESCPHIRYIGLLSTGYNIIDLAEASRRGITVTHVPAYSTDGVAQAVFALLLSFTNRVAEHHAAVAAGEWSASPDFCFYRGGLTELAGKTMGIIGYGSIGRRVAEIARAFGMSVAAHTRTLPDPAPKEVRFLTLSELLAQSDVVSIHCPLFPETEHLIDENRLAHMKRGAILINTARGQIVDEAAVRAALESGQLGGFAADVASTEPISPDNPLLGAPNCILTPHIAWAAKETRARLLSVVIQNIADFLAGDPKNRVC